MPHLPEVARTDAKIQHSLHCYFRNADIEELPPCVCPTFATLLGSRGLASNNAPFDPHDHHHFPASRLPLSVGFVIFQDKFVCRLSANAFRSYALGPASRAIVTWTLLEIPSSIHLPLSGFLMLCVKGCSSNLSYVSLSPLVGGLDLC